MEHETHKIHQIPAIGKLVIENDLDQEKGVHKMDPTMLALAGMNRGGQDGLLGSGGGLGLIALLALLKGNGGLLGGENGATTAELLNNQSVMQAINGLTAAVPNAALSTQNAILAQTNEITNIANQNTANMTAQISGVKESGQNALIASLTATNALGTNITAQISDLKTQVAAGNTAILQRIDANTIAELQAELAESRHSARAKETEVSVVTTVNQNQQQSQQQQQMSVLTNAFATLAGQVQAIHTGIVNIGSGSVRGSGNASNTSVA
jgi:hypothetical protein